MHRVVAALAPIGRALSKHRSPNALKVAKAKRPEVFAMFTSLLRWRDRTQAVGFVEGFDIIGASHPSGIFRGINPRGGADLSQVYGQNACLHTEEVLDSPA